MTPVFADTFFFLALINSRDAAHQAAVDFVQARPKPLVTTAWILTELADGLAGTRDRPLFPKILADLDREPAAVIVPPGEDLFERGKRLYLARPDKQWSLTDCISFVVMQERGLSEALTADRHFEQAGFVALLK